MNDVYCMKCKYFYHFDCKKEIISYEGTSCFPPTKGYMLCSRRNKKNNCKDFEKIGRIRYVLRCIAL